MTPNLVVRQPISSQRRVSHQQQQCCIQYSACTAEVQRRPRSAGSAGCDTLAVASLVAARGRDDLVPARLIEAKPSSPPSPLLPSSSLGSHWLVPMRGHCTCIAVAWVQTQLRCMDQGVTGGNGSASSLHPCCATPTSLRPLCATTPLESEQLSPGPSIYYYAVRTVHWVWGSELLDPVACKWPSNDPSHRLCPTDHCASDAPFRSLVVMSRKAKRHRRGVRMTMGTGRRRDNRMRLHGTGARPEQKLGLRSTGQTICGRAVTMPKIGPCNLSISGELVDYVVDSSTIEARIHDMSLQDAVLGGCLLTNPPVPVPAATGSETSSHGQARLRFPDAGKASSLVSTLISFPLSSSGRGIGVSRVGVGSRSPHCGMVWDSGWIHQPRSSINVDSLSGMKG